MVNLTELTENLNKTELEALKKAKENNETGSFSELKEKLKEFDRNTLNKIKRILKIKNKKKKDIDRTEEYFDFKEGKKDESYNIMEAAKGGEVKKYMGGGSVRKNKSNMITKRGWGASRKT
jgi:hypothetical protein